MTSVWDSRWRTRSSSRRRSAESGTRAPVDIDQPGSGRARGTASRGAHRRLQSKAGPRPSRSTPSTASSSARAACRSVAVRAGALRHQARARGLAGRPSPTSAPPTSSSAARPACIVQGQRARQRHRLVRPHGHAARHGQLPAQRRGNNQNNPNVDPQESTNSAAASGIWPAAPALTGAVFHTVNKNVIYTVDAAAVPPIFNQDDDQRVKGVTLGAIGRSRRSWQVIGNVAYLDTRRSRPRALQQRPCADADTGASRAVSGRPIAGAARHQRRRRRPSRRHGPTSTPPTPSGFRRYRLVDRWRSMPVNHASRCASTSTT